MAMLLGHIMHFAVLSALGPESFKHRLCPPLFWGGEVEEKGSIPCENLNILLSSFCLDWLVFTQGEEAGRKRSDVAAVVSVLTPPRY